MSFFGNFIQKPNGLLWFLIVVSAGPHLGLVYELSQMRPSQAETVIEISLAAPEQPQKTAMPQPPEPPATPAHRPPPPDRSVPDVPDKMENQETVPERPADPPDLTPEAVPEQVAQWQPPAAPENVSPPAPSPRPEPPRPEPPGADEMAAYFADIRLEIERNKQYPVPARRRHLEGRVTITFAVNERGDVSDVGVVESSGFSNLDSAALAAVRAAAPFAPPPEGSPNLPLRLEIPIVFQLRR